jgi:hypothetical protein
MAPLRPAATRNLEQFWSCTTTALSALLRPMSAKLKAGAIVVGLAAITALFLLQQQRQITRLVQEEANVRTQLNQVASLRVSNVFLAKWLQTTEETAQVDRIKLLEQLKTTVETAQALLVDNAAHVRQPWFWSWS